MFRPIVTVFRLLCLPGCIDFSPEDYKDLSKYVNTNCIIVLLHFTAYHIRFRAAVKKKIQGPPQARVDRQGEKERNKEQSRQRICKMVAGSKHRQQDESPPNCIWCYQERTKRTATQAGPLPALAPPPIVVTSDTFSFIFVKQPKRHVTYI